MNSADKLQYHLKNFINEIMENDFFEDSNSGALNFEYEGYIVTINKKGSGFSLEQFVGNESIIKGNFGINISAMAPGAPCTACGGSGRV